MTRRGKQQRPWSSPPGSSLFPFPSVVLLWAGEFVPATRLAVPSVVPFSFSSMLPEPSPCRLDQLTMPEASDRVTVNHPDRLHESIANRAADEPEASSLVILAHIVRLGCLGRHFLDRRPGVLFR